MNNRQSNDRQSIVNDQYAMSIGIRQCGSTNRRSAIANRHCVSAAALRAIQRRTRGGGGGGVRAARAWLGGGGRVREAVSARTVLMVDGSTADAAWPHSRRM